MLLLLCDEGMYTYSSLGLQLDSIEVCHHYSSPKSSYAHDLMLLSLCDEGMYTYSSLGLQLDSIEVVHHVQHAQMIYAV